jgi:hypothetical protein
MSSDLERSSGTQPGPVTLNVVVNRGDEGPIGKNWGRRDSIPEVANLLRGEVLRVDASTDQLAAYLEDKKHIVSMLNEAAGIVAREIRRRMDGERTWTAHVGGFKVTAPSPEPSTDYDGEKLHASLARLEKRGDAPKGTAERAVKTVTEYKPQRGEIGKLLKGGGKIATTIRRYTLTKPKADGDRRVSVTPKRHGDRNG